MKCFAFALAAFSLVAVPASAATYIGTLSGTITSGSASYNDYSTEPYQQSIIDLIGKPITIDFTTNVTLNYYDAVNDLFYPKYVVSTVAVHLPIPAPFDNYGSSQSNDYYANPFGGTDFTGNAHSGSLMIGGFIFDPDFKQYVSFNFANASSSGGSLTGNGTASAGFYNPVAQIDDYYQLAFNLTSGMVSASAVPEPAGWALMIAGFGAIGVTLRRRRAADPIPAIA